MKYIFDTDPGIDDAIAIMLGYLNKLDIIGFTLATGNISKEKSANNLKTIQDILKSNIPMYYGSRENNCEFMSAEYAHGKDGLGNIFMPASLRKFENTFAEDFIIDACNKYDDITFVCLGPLTNLASTIKKDKSIINKIKHVVIMGTTYNESVKIPYKEFNVKIDPESAKVVFDAGFNDIKIITHDIALMSCISKDYIDTLYYSNKITSKFLYIISQKYIEFCKTKGIDNALATPDPTTVASIINPNILEFKPCTVTIKDDLSYVNLTDKSNLSVATKVNNKLFEELFKKTFN